MSTFYLRRIYTVPRAHNSLKLTFGTKENFSHFGRKIAWKLGCIIKLPCFTNKIYSSKVFLRKLLTQTLVYIMHFHMINLYLFIVCRAYEIWPVVFLFISWSNFNFTCSWQSSVYKYFNISQTENSYNCELNKRIINQTNSRKCKHSLSSRNKEIWDCMSLKLSGLLILIEISGAIAG